MLKFGTLHLFWDTYGINSITRQKKNQLLKKMYRVCKLFFKLCTDAMKLNQPSLL